MKFEDAQYVIILLLCCLVGFWCGYHWTDGPKIHIILEYAK